MTFNKDIAPYRCLKCNNMVGLSYIEQKHNCNKPLFDKDGNITINFKKLYGELQKYIL